MLTISHYSSKLIKNLIFAFVFTGQIAWGKEFFQMKNPNGDVVNLSLAITRQQNIQGLSGLKSKDFKASSGMLFVNPDMSPRRFWMPDTYFNLDIIFLDQNLKIVGIEKNVPAHPGNSEPPAIYRTDSYNSQFILETKAGAIFGSKLKKDDQLKFTGSSSLSEIVLRTRQQL